MLNDFNVISELLFHNLYSKCLSSSINGYDDIFDDTFGAIINKNHLFSPVIEGGLAWNAILIVSLSLSMPNVFNLIVYSPLLSKVNLCSSLDEVNLMFTTLDVVLSFDNNVNVESPNKDVLNSI